MDKAEFGKIKKWPKWTGRTLFQHAWNLGWAGGFSMLCAYLVRNDPVRYLPVLALVPWLADWGYFMATDIPELGGVVAQAQTYIVSAACVLGVTVSADAAGAEGLPFMEPASWQLLFSTLGAASLLNKVTWKLGIRQRNPGHFM